MEACLFAEIAQQFTDAVVAFNRRVVLEARTKLLHGEMHLEAMREDGEPIPEPTTLARTVAVPA